MLRWTLIFFIISLVAAIFGFGGISSASADMARIIFYLFLVVFFISLVASLFTGRGTRIK